MDRRASGLEAAAMEALGYAKRAESARPTTFEEAVGEVMRDMQRVLIAKQRDYGHANITQFGVLGVLIRASDKLARLRNLLWDRPRAVPATPVNESIIDSWIDLANYAVIALMLYRGTFTLPLEENKPNA